MEPKDWLTIAGSVGAVFVAFIGMFGQRAKNTTDLKTQQLQSLSRDEQEFRKTILDQLKIAQGEIDTLKTNVTKLTSELRELRERYDELDEENLVLRKEVERLGTENTNLREQIQRREQEIKATEQLYETLNTRYKLMLELCQCAHMEELKAKLKEEPHV